jgi:zinc-finger of the FCS-type, C2-C2
VIRYFLRMALIRQCHVCGKDFETKQFYVNRGQGMFCSRECRYKTMRTGRLVSCSSCNKEIYRKPRQLRLSKSALYFCDKSCQTRWRNEHFVGAKHANWIHGRSAYKTVLKRIGRAKICEICETVDERVLAVHHIDRVRTNIDPSNLVWLCHNCHFLVHHYDVGRDRGLLRPRS